MDKHTPQSAVLAEKVSIHQVFMMATFSPQHEGSCVFSHPLHVQCGGKFGRGQMSPRQASSNRGGGCGGSNCSSASCTSSSGLPSANHLRSHWIYVNTLPDSGHREGGWAVPQQIWEQGGVRGSQSRVQALTSPFVPAACRACNCSQKHPGKVFCPATSSTSTAIRSANLSACCLMFPQQPSYNPLPCLLPSTTHLE